MFNKIRNFILYTIIAGIILLAVAISAARILLPDVQSYRSYVEQQLASVLEHPVKIASLDAFMSGVSPVVVFHDVKLLSSDAREQILEISKIKIGFSLWRSIQQQKLVPDIYTIDGVELAITRQQNGKILVQDVDVVELGGNLADQSKPTNNELSEWLFNRSSLIIQNSSIVWHDKKRKTKPAHFSDVTLRLKNSSNRHQFNGEFILSKNNKAQPKKLELALDVYGDMLDPIKWVGKFYANGKNIDANEWGFKPVIMDVMVESGKLDFKLWGDWVAGELNTIEADVSAREVVLKRLKNNAVANVKLLSGIINWNKKQDNWNLSIGKLKYVSDKASWPETSIKVARILDKKTAAETLRTEVKYCRIEDIRDLLLKSGYIENRVFRYLRKAAPSGDISDIQYNITTQTKPLQKQQATKKTLSRKTAATESEVTEYFLTAKVNKLTFNSFENIPGIKGITGEIYANQNSGLLKINSNNAGVDYPDFLVAPVELDQLTGNLEWRRNKNSWDFVSKEISVSNEDVAAIVSFNLNIPEGTLSPFMDLQAKITRGKASATKKYMPASVMKGSFKRWVDNAFLAGEIKEGGVVLNGRLDKFPFNDNDGVFKTYIVAENLKVNYMPDWPYLKNGSAEAVFSGEGVKVKVRHVELLNSYADNFVISLDNFNKPNIKMNAKVISTVDDLAQFSSTTFLKDSRGFVKDSSFSGKADVVAAMTIPLSDEVEKLYPFSVEAEVQFMDAGIITLKNRIVATNINGKASVTENSVNARGIKAKILGGDSNIDIFTRHEYGGHPIRLVMQGNIDVGDTMKRFGIAGYDRVKGRTDWQGVFTLAYKQDGLKKNQTFQISSSMQGIDIDLPVPVKKKASKKVPTYLSIENVSAETMLVHLVYGEAMSYAMDVDLSDTVARLRRGEFRFKPEAAHIPDDNILLVTGSLWNFSLRDWLDALDATSIKSEKSFLGIPIHMDMDILHLAKTKDLKPRKPSDPRKLPTFEGIIEQFEYDTYQYGTARFKTVNEIGGLRLKWFTIDSPHVAVKGQGYWHYSPSKQSSEMTMEVKSEDYGELLTSLGFTTIIEDGVAKFTGDFNWDGGFGDFSWAKLNGIITVDITNGRITKVDPGAGRLLGILSLESLPGMIFTGDAFKEGFNFDRIVGAYEILDGDAYSDDVSITGPAASMLVTGRTGIVKRDFDHYITVVPNVSGTLPLTSGFVFGPQVGAVIYFFKNLFGSGIDESSKRIYHLTGTWDKPVVERIDKNEDPAEKTSDVQDETDDES